MAIERGYKYYFWGHADVAIGGEGEPALLADELHACAESAHKSHPRWGVISMNGTFFSAIRTDAMREVRRHCRDPERMHAAISKDDNTPFLKRSTALVYYQ